MYREPGPTGAALLKMLRGCQHRGPDSTGLALYGPDGEAVALRRYGCAESGRVEVVHRPSGSEVVDQQQIQLYRRVNFGSGHHHAECDGNPRP